MGSFELISLAVPANLIIILFLSFSSQYLFLYLDPRPLSRDETITFNVNIALVLICLARTSLTDPGHIPKLPLDEKEPGNADAEESTDGTAKVITRQRWCRVCESRKPPRSHHCRKCKRCIPKMDHHCPWTGNCVSHRTLPHFARFVTYSVIAMMQLEYHLWLRLAHLWSVRNFPVYHSPSVFQLSHLFTLAFGNSLALFGLSVLLFRTIWILLFNITTIEDWEIERHETLLRRARVAGGYLDGPDGLRVRIQRQEYPFDIGIWSNIKQGMGTGNIIAWFWPFSSTPTLESGLEYETNGFEDPSLGWPPPDPDRIPRLARRSAQSSYLRDSDDEITTLREFRKRQKEDLKRWNTNNDRTRSSSNATSYSLTVPPLDAPIESSDSPDTPTHSPAHHIRRRQPFHQRFGVDAIKANDLSHPDLYVNGEDPGEEGWTNQEGDGLKDFGLDEEAEFYDEEDVPLAELLERRRAEAKGR